MSQISGKWGWLLAVLGVIFLLNGVYADQKQTAIQKKGDLALLKCRTELVRVQDMQNRHWIRIHATVANLVPGTRTEAFILRTEYRDHSAGAWHSLAQQTYTGPLHFSPAARKAPSRDVRADAYVPIGKRHDYRLTILPTRPLDDANAGNNTGETHYRTVVIGDGGGDEAVIRGVDLVVASVEVRRGVYAGARKVQIVPVIRNMWHGRTNTRIRISIHEFSLAWWIEGGIGGNEEKRGGAVYIDDPHGTVPLTFSVVVDSANEIPENNETNNRCGPISLSATQESIIHRCPIVGPHEDLH
jgi:hypothetical protein